MSRYEEIAHEVAAEGTEAAWAARDAILELTAEVAALRELVGVQTETREKMEAGARLREEIIAAKEKAIAMQAQTIATQKQTIEELKKAGRAQAELLLRQSEIIERLMGKGVLYA